MKTYRLKLYCGYAFNDDFILIPRKDEMTSKRHPSFHAVGTLHRL